MIPFLLAPAVALMQRLRLLPKFAVLTTVFVLPLAWTTGLLLHELDRSIAASRLERSGAAQLIKLEEIVQQLQLHRAYQHMYVMGNADAERKAQEVQKNVNGLTAAMDASSVIFVERYDNGAWKAFKGAWSALQRRLSATKDRKLYADETALIGQLTQLGALVADRTDLTHDPETETYRLAALFAGSLPRVAERVADIGARGAAYIDSGLMEANEEVLLGSTVMLTQSDVAALPEQFEALFRDRPALKRRLADAVRVDAGITTFLARARSEVLNSFNQTSGDEFVLAAKAVLDDLYRSSAASAALFDALLQARIDDAVMHRNLIVAGIVGILALAAYFLIGFYLSFSSGVRQLSQALKCTTAGDLSSRIRIDGKDEIAALLHGFVRMNDGLAGIVRQVRAGSNTIALASEEIAVGNQNLSMRTEEQASSLEETAASMEELSSTVRQNAASAQQANQLAQAASRVARDGGDVVQRVVGTMTTIERSAGEIVDIVGIVDSIAFQTNILALNAAVEAARAGEQGRGFAVVAAEVRTLAQRSALAAKEIKTLIDGTVAQLEEGSGHATRAGKTMGEIVASIDHVAIIMQEITAAGHEQQRGIEHIAQAMTQMDGITQQNAALVEQAAAAAESMHQQTGKLSETVAIFRVAEEAIAVAATPQHHAGEEDRHRIIELATQRALPRRPASNSANADHSLAVANGS